MNKQRHIFLKKISIRRFPDLLFGSVRLLSKNLKSEKKVKTLSLWAFILLAGPACLIYMVQE
tara:strand:- start:375 stop:560 length:186 start_codon:yes stop_codon:yes gene_type:complete